MLVHHAKVNPRAPFFPGFYGKKISGSWLLRSSKITTHVSPKIARPIKTIKTNKTTMLQTCHEYLCLPPRSWSCLVRDGPLGRSLFAKLATKHPSPERLRQDSEDSSRRLGLEAWHILTHLDTSTLKRIAVINLRLYWDNRCCPAVALSILFQGISRISNETVDAKERRCASWVCMAKSTRNTTARMERSWLLTLPRAAILCSSVCKASQLLTSSKFLK